MSTDVLTLAKAHFDGMRGRIIEVPEWPENGETLQLHCEPMSLRKRHEIQSRARGNDSRALALTLILMARRSDGSRVFPDDAETLAALETGVDPAVITRVVGEMIQTSTAASLGN